MSTVLRPVGPEPPQVYWMRRGFILLGVLILILIVAEACGGGGGKSPSAGNPPNPTSSSTPSTPQPCTPAETRLTVSADKAAYSIGEQPTFTGVFTNASDVACTLTLSTATETWTVISGPTTIWTTKGCPSTTKAKTKVKTLQPGATKSVSIQWEGKLYSNCQPSADLQNGQYIVRAKLDGFTPGKGFPFEMTNSTGG